MQTEYDLSLRSYILTILVLQAELKLCEQSIVQPYVRRTQNVNENFAVATVRGDNG